MKRSDEYTPDDEMRELLDAATSPADDPVPEPDPLASRAEVITMAEMPDGILSEHMGNEVRLSFRRKDANLVNIRMERRRADGRMFWTMMTADDEFLGILESKIRQVRDPASDAAGRQMAAQRIKSAAETCASRNVLDQEEIDHLHEIARLIEEGRPVSLIMDFAPTQEQTND